MFFACLQQNSFLLLQNGICPVHAVKHYLEGLLWFGFFHYDHVKRNTGLVVSLIMTSSINHDTGLVFVSSEMIKYDTGFFHYDKVNMILVW